MRLQNEQNQKIAHTTFPDAGPQLLLAVKLLKMIRQPHLPGANVPEQNPERVHVHARVVPPRQQFRRHVYRRPDDAPRHHRLRYAETKIRQLRSVVSIQLKHQDHYSTLPERYTETHKDVFEFDVAVYQTLGVEIADTLDHVDGDLYALRPRKSGFQPAV